MEERDTSPSMKVQMLSDYDSDETIVDDSIPGSDGEDDELQLKRLVLSSDVSVTTLASLHLGNRRIGLGPQSPEIQHMCASVTGTQMGSMKTATREVCDMLSKEELSQSLLRNWTKDSGNPKSGITSGKASSEDILDPTYFSGLCEDSQYLIQSAEYEETDSEDESPKTNLLSGIIINDHFSPEKETVLLKKFENIKLQNKAPDLILMSEKCNVETASEECSLELSDSEANTNLSRSITSDLKIDKLLDPINESESLSEMTDILDSQQYLPFMEVSTDDNSKLASELLKAIISVQSPEVQHAGDQLEHTMMGDHYDEENQITKTLHTEFFDDHTQVPSLTFLHEYSDYEREKGEDKLPTHSTNKETKEGPSQTEENNPRRPFNTTKICGYTTSHCLSAGQQLVNQTSFQDSKENCTNITDDWDDITAVEDSSSCSQPSPSILNNTSPTVMVRNPGTGVVAVRRSQRIPKKAVCAMDQYELQLPEKQKSLQTINIDGVPLASQNVFEFGKNQQGVELRRSAKRKCAQEKSKQSSSCQLRKNYRIQKTSFFSKKSICAFGRKFFTDTKFTNGKLAMVSKSCDNSRKKRSSTHFGSVCNRSKNRTADETNSSATQCLSSKTLGNIHKRNFMGETKLHQASKKGDLKLVNALIEAGVDVNQKDNAGWMAIHEASCNGYTEIIRALLQAGADVNSKGLDGILPIHDAVFCNHFKVVELLLEFGANLDERDNIQENAFDKCCNDKMLELLKSHSAFKETSSINVPPGAEIPQVKIISTAASNTQKHMTRDKCGMETLATLQEIEIRQKKLLSTELQTSEDSDKYIEEMRWIQDVLNKIVILQRNERDTLAKKYRASVDSFRQGILRDKIAKLASRQKALLKVVHTQKEVALKIMEYQQTKRSDTNNGDKSSSLNYCDTSPGRNQISDLCTANEWHDSNIANGSTMVTNMPAVCRVPHIESNQFQRSFRRERSRTGALVSERPVQHRSNLALNEMPMGIENSLFSLNSCSSITPGDSHEETNDQLGLNATVSKSPNSILVNNSLNITDKSKISVKKFNHRTTVERHKSAHAGQHLQSPNFEEDSYQTDMSGSSVLDDLSENGRPQHAVTVHRNTTLEQCINDYTIDMQSPKRPRLEVQRKTKKVPMSKLIKMGKLKPGHDVLWFQLQDYSHKATLLPDGHISDCSGAIYRDPAQWVKALLGNNLSVSWKYVANKVTYLGKKLSSFMEQEVFVPKKCNHQTPQDQSTVSSSLHPTTHTVLQVKEILLIDKSEFFPCHLMDQYWEDFLISDSQAF
ncbi:ankyrin repeat domain-containing protein 31 isoform X2 [Mixophyes fleayi]